MSPHSWHLLLHVKPGNAVEFRGIVKLAACGLLGSLCARPIAIRWLVAGYSQYDCSAAAFAARPPVCALRLLVIEPTTWRHDMCALEPVRSRYGHESHRTVEPAPGGDVSRGTSRGSLLFSLSERVISRSLTRITRETA